ncbi:MAG: hypothetical protein COU42_01485 [Candidatus Nealsonbacteria bacterium CG10_big_fil_rev_8_21_14_0_10_36_24]|uniref:Methyltransferase domain-containing protein n=2 Tax=Candidatus Nealsoniibacteriota TaxID=1817911 RepID=A0A2H0YNK6_9BACT|nr:MAG: hypothetical protein COU42_01485 [Candidatus Nealsonbacteria bacterium CG10_big_fil_rev_8_21_14_0_10_36_24]PIS40068.1 MAG: hypothetical protein COT32_01620 [Candidatus Nealsonbacteria bacterium CG08_land_8_20_14_0_20_36_22]
MIKSKNKNFKKWGYKENSKKLYSRTNVHKNFSEKDIDVWMLGIVKIKGDERILDLGCGDGKQIIAFGKKLTKGGKIIGCDISNELLKKAEEKAKENNINASFLLHDINQPFSFKDEEFDFISSLFSIYYVKNPLKVILEIKRLLNKKGKLFIAGPTPNNARDFWELHSKITNKKIPQVSLERGTRIHNTFIPLIRKYFRNTEIDIFKNIVHFPSSEELLKYYSSSLLLEESSKNREEKKIFLDKMKREVEKFIERNGAFDIKKEVYGILAYK